MDVFSAIQARKKLHDLQHFEKTRYGKKLAELKGAYKGRHCFIIGNGPSLTAEDLDRLKGEYCFAFNRIYYIFDKTTWRPTFYCTQDDIIVRNSLSEIRSKIKTPFVFAPINLKWYYDLDVGTEYYFCQRQADSEDSVPVFSEDIAHEIGVGNTVAYTAIQLAVYMGFSSIYLLGVDHSFHVSQDKAGNIVVDPHAKDYFCDAYNRDKDELFIPKLDVSTLSYIAAKRYADTHNVDIFNATRGGKLEIFQRVDFERLF